MTLVEQYEDGDYVSDMNLSEATKDELLDLKQAVDNRGIELKAQIEAAKGAEERSDEQWWVNVNYAKRKTGQESQYIQRLVAKHTRREKDERIDRSTTESAAYRHALTRAINELLSPSLANQVLELADEMAQQRIQEFRR